ncbi:MAG: GNAT family N-acetyltransferase [Roseinatronobacter sp.]
MSDKAEQGLTNSAGAALGHETLRGKQITVSKLSQPPAQEMARFCFRAWEAADAALYQSLLDDAELWRYMPEDYPGEITTELAQSLIDLSGQVSHHKVRAVEYQGRVVGQVRMQWHTDVTPPQSGEISYWLGRDYWGLGLAAPMIALFTWRCLSIFPALSTIIARVHRDNASSQRVLERLGWREVGSQGDWLVFELRRSDGIDWSRLRKPGPVPG